MKLIVKKEDELVHILQEQCGEIYGGLTLTVKKAKELYEELGNVLGAIKKDKICESSVCLEDILRRLDKIEREIEMGKNPYTTHWDLPPITCAHGEEYYNYSYGVSANNPNLKEGWTSSITEQKVPETFCSD